MIDSLTEQDINNLQRSWGKQWRKHISGKEAVLDRATTLFANMTGKGWAIHISENLGWFFWLQNEGLQLWELENQGKCTYHCLLHEDGMGGEIFWSDPQYYDDPNEAVEAQLKIAQDFINRQQKVIDKVKHNLKTTTIKQAPK